MWLGATVLDNSQGMCGVTPPVAQQGCARLACASYSGTSHKQVASVVMIQGDSSSDDDQDP
jgi:hypothetical protein